MAISGGGKMETVLAAIGKSLTDATQVKVGFLEGAVYPDGMPVAYIAAINEFGATIRVDPRQQIIYKKTLANGNFAKSGMFVKKKSANFKQTVDVGAHTITIPSRPFFRTMIAKHQSEWPGDIAKIAKANNTWSAKQILLAMGAHIAAQLQESITKWDTPKNAPSTIRRKGFDNPLIDKSTMLKSVDWIVE